MANVSIPSSGPSLAMAKDTDDGWDDDGDDWETFNDAKPKQSVATAVKKPTPIPAANSSDLPMPSLAKLSMKPAEPAPHQPPPSRAPKKQDSWNDGGDDDWSNTKFTPVNQDTDNKTSRMDEAKRKREERKQQRLKEIEAKRAAKSGPMKLGGGGQKDNQFWDDLQ